MSNLQVIFHADAGDEPWSTHKFKAEVDLSMSTGHGHDPGEVCDRIASFISDLGCEEYVHVATTVMNLLT